MIDCIAFAVDEHVGDVGKLRDTIVGGLLSGNLDSVTSLESGGAVAIGIEGVLSVGKDCTAGCKGNDDC